jgi:hypothetical protein
MGETQGVGPAFHSQNEALRSPTNNFLFSTLKGGPSKIWGFFSFLPCRCIANSRRPKTASFGVADRTKNGAVIPPRLPPKFWGECCEAHKNHMLSDRSTGISEWSFRDSCEGKKRAASTNIVMGGLEFFGSLPSSQRAGKWSRAPGCRASGEDRSQVNGSDRKSDGRWRTRKAIAGGGERSQVEGSDRRWREAIAG